MRLFVGYCFIFSVLALHAQKNTLSGFVRATGDPVVGATVVLNPGNYQCTTNANGEFTFGNLTPTVYSLEIKILGYQPYFQKNIKNFNVLYIDLIADNQLLQEVGVAAARTGVFGRKNLEGVENFGIFEGKKSEVIEVSALAANLATNNARQVFAKIPGLNIWESDGAGIQLGIGARGLNPNRSAHLNTRQSGYDISADPLGYPETYYTPPVEALERIEFVRGAASLQYGTQFGGMLNFVFRKPKADRQISFRTRQTLGSFGFLGSYNEISGSTANQRVQYLAFFQHRRGEGWRPNSGFEVNTAYFHTLFRLHPNVSLTAEYTYLKYLAQQPGGLTDSQFENDPRQSIRSRNWFAVHWSMPALLATWEISPKTRVNMRAFGLVSSRDAVGNLERIHVADLGGPRTLISGQFRNAGLETRLLQEYTLGSKKQTWLAGFRYFRGNTITLQGNGNAGTGPDFEFVNPENLEGSDYAFENRNYAAFTEHIFRFSEKWSITPGARFEWIGTGADGSFRQQTFDFAGNVITDTTLLDNTQRTRSLLLLGIGTSYKPNHSAEWYANLSQNYRAINFNDLRIVNPNSLVDPNIHDERGFTADLGVRGNWRNRLNFDASLFAMVYRDRIGQILRADLPPLYQEYRYRTNLGDARYLGIEAYVEADVLNWARELRSSKSLMIFLNASVLDARYLKSNDRSVAGNWVEMAPPTSMRGGITFSTKQFKTTLQSQFVAEQFTDATNARLVTGAVTGIIPAYWVTDLTATLSLPWHLSIEVSCNNVLDARYFTRRAEAYPGPGIIPSDGRGFYITLAGSW